MHDTAKLASKQKRKPWNTKTFSTAITHKQAIARDIPIQNLHQEQQF